MLASCSNLIKQQNHTLHKEHLPNIIDKDYTKNPQVIAMMTNKLSMTASLKKLDKNFSVQELYSGTENDLYKRFVTLKLESTPVIVAVSSTYQNNQKFYAILAHSKNSSIGLKLFAPNSGITRNSNMLISIVTVNQIDSKILQKYLLELGYTPSQKIVERKSIFLYKNIESVQLTEYLLPSIINFIKE